MQRISVLIGSFLLALVVLFPPTIGVNQRGREWADGHKSLFSIGSVETFNAGDILLTTSYRIDYQRLATILIVIATTTTACAFAFRRL